MKKFFCLLIIFINAIGVSLAEKSKPDTVKIGAYVMSIHDINFRDKEYTMRYWLWMLHNKQGLDVVKQTEIPNAKTSEHTEVFIDSLGNKLWVIMKMKSIIPLIIKN
jgi:aromatic ring-cleaving dioxygenase